MDGGENTYGGCESLNAVHTKLKPSGGHGFIIKKKKVVKCTHSNVG